MRCETPGGEPDTQLVVAEQQRAEGVLCVQAACCQAIARFPVLNFSFVCQFKDLIFASGFCDFKFLAFCGLDTSIFYLIFHLVY